VNTDNGRTRLVRRPYGRRGDSWSGLQSATGNAVTERETDARLEYSRRSDDYVNVWTPDPNGGRVRTMSKPPMSLVSGSEDPVLSLRLVVLSSLLVITVGCGSNYSTPATPSPSPSPAPAPGGPSASVAIPIGAETLGNRAFAPDALSVAVGTTVTWTNSDAVAHTSTSNAPGWNSGSIAPGGQFSVAFPTAGTFPYHCAIHPGMIGSVVVQ